MKSFNKNTIKQYINYYSKLEDKIVNKQDYKHIQETIASLKDLMSCTYFNISDILPHISTLKEIQEEDYLFLKLFGSYCPIFRNFNNELEIIPEYDNKLSEIVLTKKQVLKLVLEFYHSLDNELATILDKIYKGNTYIKFNKDSYSIYSNNKMLGFTYLITNTDIVFMNIGKENNLSFLVTAIHEFAHAIAFFINCNHSTDFNKDTFSEVEGLFMEMVSYDFINSVFNKSNDTLKMSIDEYNNLLTYNRIICGKLDIYSQLNNKDLKSKKIIKNYIINHGDHLLKEDVDKICYETIDTNTSYVISYLTAVELFMIYQRDRKIAVDILKDIIKLKNMSIQEYLKTIINMGITPSQNIHNYVKYLYTKEGGEVESKRVLCRH